MHTKKVRVRRLLLLSIVALTWCALTPPARAQDTVTGAFEGTVSHGLTRARITDAAVEIINQATGETFRLRTDSAGRFFQALLPPGTYRVRVSAPGFVAYEREQRLFTTAPNQVVPIPVALEPAGAAAAAAPTAPPAPPATPNPSAGVVREVVAEINRTDARRSGAFTEGEIATLPLGIVSLVRSFDELALLLPGVALPPQTQGDVAGPGVGPGVGSAGQFTANGLRSRANNFTVDGSDNNDEDIGVRRQGFVALIPQPVESVKEYQVTTLLPSAQFGRNIGAQVNAVSKSGGSETHGTLYGFFNSSQLNARDFFDTASGTASLPLRAGNQPVLLSTTDLGGNETGPPRPLTVRNQSGGEDSTTFGQGGFVLGGPLVPGRGPGEAPRLFYFVSAEGHVLNATREESFAVPTVEQRGAFNAGATGIFRDPFNGLATATVPNTINGSAVFSLYPFPNNPDGVYGPNTLTQVLPASGHGKVLSGKLDGNFRVRGRRQAVTGRYNFTDDFRQIPATGGAIFSTLAPRVRTQNFSFFLNSDVSAPNSARAVFNQVRLSYGRTRLSFDEVRDQSHVISSLKFPDTPFLLNAPELVNVTTPPQPGVANSGPVLFRRSALSVEEEIGPVGQVFVAGFSPIGVDVYNFPQRRVNNTYQVADEVNVRAGVHHLIFGADWRRSELNSDLPRIGRPLVTFNGAPRLVFENGTFRPPTDSEPNQFIRPEDLVALGAASNFYLTLNTVGNDAKNSLRYYQNNFYGMDEWRVLPSLSLSYGLRYEYNTPVRELNRRIENTFDSPALNLAPGLRGFIEGRTQIFDPDRNNLAPRVSVAYGVNPLSRGYAAVIRGGYGLLYDQILGAVVSQSRNVYPTFLTLNFGGLNASSDETFLNIFNPGNTFVGTDDGGNFSLTRPGTLNQLNPALPLGELLPLINEIFPASLGATLPARRLDTPLAHHYTLAWEQQIGARLTVSTAYVGTAGRHLLRFTTPNLGPSSTLVPTSFSVFFENQLALPLILGRVRSPPRPVAGIGTVNRFETTARSRYDSLQLQARGHSQRGLQLQASYTLAKVTDDVSDVFDLAGAPALPQDSFDLGAERGPANFDVRHRFAYYFVYDLPESTGGGATMRSLFGGLQLAGTGAFQTGQPFTVNSIFDVNLDGNLTDRLDTTQGLLTTGERRRPLRLTVAPQALLAPVGQNGLVGRNVFRAGGVMEVNLSVSKKIGLSARQNVLFRIDIFNLTNRANFGVPVRYLEATGFGGATGTVTPGRRVQLALKYSF